MSSVEEGEGEDNSRTSSVLCRVHTAFDEGEVTDLDLPRQREFAAGVHSKESPQLLPINFTAPESLRHEGGQASSIIADRNSTHVFQMDESEDWVVTDPDALTDVVENELETTRAPSRNEGAQDAVKESTGSSIRTEREIESELL